MTKPDFTPNSGSRVKLPEEQRTGLQDKVIKSKKPEEEPRRLSHAVEQSPAIAVITDSERTIEYINLQFVQLTGYSSEEAIGKNPRILTPGQHPPEFYQHLWETITDGREWRGESCNKVNRRYFVGNARQALRGGGIRGLEWSHPTKALTDMLFG